MRKYEEYRDPKTDWHGHIFPTRYLAELARSHSQYHGDEAIVKVSGGYRLMRWEEYNVWKKQK